MSDKPGARRWYQFRLSTILVLVGIAAWAMAMRPWVEVRIVPAYNRSAPPGAPRRIMIIEADLLEVRKPFYALLAFLTFKGVLRLIERREQQIEPAEAGSDP